MVVARALQHIPFVQKYLHMDTDLNNLNTVHCAVS